MRQAAELGLALVLSAAIGLEREMRQKSAGLSRADRPGEPPTVEVTMQIHGKGQVNELAAGLSDIPGVRAVAAEDVHAIGE